MIIALPAPVRLAGACLHWQTVVVPGTGIWCLKHAHKKQQLIYTPSTTLFPANPQAVTTCLNSNLPGFGNCTPRSCQPCLQIRTVAVNSLTGLLLAIDEEGRSLLINKRRRTLLHRFSFKGPVAAAAFSPDGRYIACAVGKLLQVLAAIACLPVPQGGLPAASAGSFVLTMGCLQRIHK